MNSVYKELHGKHTQSAFVLYPYGSVNSKRTHPSRSFCRIVPPPRHGGAFLINCLFVGGESVIVEFYTFYMQILKRNTAYLKNTSTQWEHKQSHWRCRGIYRETVTVCKELYFCLLVHPRSSLTETKSSRKKSSFPAEMPLIKSVGAANGQSPVIPRELWLCTKGTPRLGCVLTNAKMTFLKEGSFSRGV